jgi:hypothetical protein
MPITEMFFSLHTEHPGAIGGPPANELSYPQYARVRANLTAVGGWSFPGSAKSRADANETVVSFPKCVVTSSAASGVARFWAVCSANEALMFVGTLQPAISVRSVVGLDVTPQIVLAPLGRATS